MPKPENQRPAARFLGTKDLCDRAPGSGTRGSANVRRHAGWIGLRLTARPLSREYEGLKTFRLKHEVSRRRCGHGRD